jgi:hypothetical protein
MDRISDSKRVKGDGRLAIDQAGEGEKRAGLRRFIGTGGFAKSELAALAIMLVIVAAVAVCCLSRVGADGRHGLMSALFAALRGSNSLLYVK